MMSRAVKVVVLLCLAVAALYADRGAIAVTPNVNVFEPNQRAYIAWDGKEEILILSTDVKTDGATKVVEVMPFPSLPQVTQADTNVFEKLQQYLARRTGHGSAETEKGMGAERREPPPDVRFIFHKRIGHHSVTVVRIRSTTALQSSMNQILAQHGGDTIVIPSEMVGTIQEYIRERYEYFAIDVVSLDTALSSQQPLRYRFKSPCVYYPLRITRTAKGPTEVDIVVVNTNCILVPDEKRCIQGMRPLLEQMLFLDGLPQADSVAYALLKNARHCGVLTYWSVRANPSDLTRDLVLQGKTRRARFGRARWRCTDYQPR
jgi:hypothetical protein